jgi:hypothetical protein
MDVATS